MKNLFFCLLVLLNINVFANHNISELPAKVQIMHTIDPFQGDFKSNLSLPINFTGNLYFRVLNASDYVDKNLYIVFSLKDDPNNVVIPATVAIGPGLTKDINGEYLAIATNTQPFTNIRFFPIRCRLFGYCPETTSIQLVSFDSLAGVSTTIATSFSTKIFFRQANALNKGQEVLFEDYIPCSSSADCALGNCCYNNRCWKRDLVGQCSEDSSFQNQPIGNICSSHYECESLCCDGIKNVCSPHKSKDGVSQLCGQYTGSYCVDQTWCHQQTVKDCRIIKTGTNSSGFTTCELFCYDRIEHGTCLNHICSSPATPPVPVFDPANPDCRYAQDPLTFIL